MIVDFNRHFDAEPLAKIMDFLDFACNLFDGPVGDWNKIINTLKLLRDSHHLIDDKLWEALHMWLPQHKRCGAFLKLMFNADIEASIKPQEELVEPSYLEFPVLPTEKRAAKKPKSEKKSLAPVLKKVIIP